MERSFITDDFLLTTKAARRLFHDYAKGLPIFDYHCHLPVLELAENRQFENLTRIWLQGDHYKWRALRACGVDERLITGDASDYEKFEVWAATVPYTVRNPLYHWTHMELRNPFGVDQLLSPATAQEIYQQCSEKLQSDHLRAHGILKHFDVRALCTTDDPADTLDHHASIRASGLATVVVPCFRPDAALQVEQPEAFNSWITRLEEAAGTQVRSFEDLLAALEQRHDAFHAAGCRMSDHGLEELYADEYSASDVQQAFRVARDGNVPDEETARRYKSAVLFELARLDARRNWTQQFHLGALRNINSRGFARLGANTGYDSMGDFQMARSVARFLDRLASQDSLAKTILYNLNPINNDLFASMIGNFQDGSVRGKVQFGAAWWFNDQLQGMESQMNALSNSGLISLFVGMVTDSRSFLSYPRHEYFRRLVCRMFGDEVERGELPQDFELLGGIIQDISYNNAARYFGIEH